MKENRGVDYLIAVNNAHKLYEVRRSGVAMYDTAAVDPQSRGGYLGLRGRPVAHRRERRRRGRRRGSERSLRQSRRYEALQGKASKGRGC